MPHTNPIVQHGPEYTLLASFPRSDSMMKAHKQRLGGLHSEPQLFATFAKDAAQILVQPQLFSTHHSLSNTTYYHSTFFYIPSTTFLMMGSKDKSGRKVSWRCLIQPPAKTRIANKSAQGFISSELENFEAQRQNNISNAKFHFLTFCVASHSFHLVYMFIFHQSCCKFPGLPCWFLAVPIIFFHQKEQF